MIKAITRWILGFIYGFTLGWHKAKLDKGEYTVFTNVRGYYGNQLDPEVLKQDFLIDHKAMLLLSDQGNIIMIHGNSDGTVEFGGENISLQEVVDALQLSGNWILLSCYNGTRDSEVDGCEFFKPRELDSEYPIFFTLENGNMYCTTGVFAERYNQCVEKLVKIAA